MRMKNVEVADRPEVLNACFIKLPDPRAWIAVADAWEMESTWSPFSSGCGSYSLHASLFVILQTQNCKQTRFTRIYKYFLIHKTLFLFFFFFHTESLMMGFVSLKCSCISDLRFPITISTLSFAAKVFVFVLFFVTCTFSHLLHFGFRTQRIADEFQSHSFVCFESCVWSSC